MNDPPRNQLTEQSPFYFEREYDLNYEDYVVFENQRRLRLRSWRTSLSLMIGVILLFWSYTFVLGVLLLGMLGIEILKPSLIGMTRKKFSDQPNLHGPILYGVSNSRLWIRTEMGQQSCVWGNLVSWVEYETWLRLYPNKMQPLNFRVDDLKEGGVYADVLEKINSTGATRRGR